MDLLPSRKRNKAGRLESYERRRKTAVKRSEASVCGTPHLVVALGLAVTKVVDTETTLTAEPESGNPARFATIRGKLHTPTYDILRGGGP